MIQKNSLRNTISLALFLLLLSINGWSMYQIYHSKETSQNYAYQTEAMYQRNFGALSDSIEMMHDQLAQLLITTSQERLLSGLSCLWREVYAAISSLAALPIAMQQLEQTDLLLHDIAEYSYYLMRKNVLQQNPLSEDDWAQLKTFYQRFHVVYLELESLESTILSENLHLSTVSLDDEKNPIHTTFQSIEQQITAFPEITFTEGIRKIAPEPHPIQETQITEAQAIANANQFVSILQQTKQKNKNISQQSFSGEIVFRTNNTKIPVYGIAYSDNQYIEVSQSGGYILQYYHTRELHAPTYTIDQAKAQAEALLKKIALPSMVCVECNEDSNIASFVFVPKQEDVYLYPDMIKLQLALDNGELLSFDQTSYQTQHHQRTLSSPKLSEESILKNQNPNFQLTTIHLALIPDLYSNKELLAYELRGNIFGESFSIFIDAQTGQELRIIHL